MGHLSPKEVDEGLKILDDMRMFLNKNYNVKKRIIKILIGMIDEYKFHILHHLLPKWAYVCDIDFVEARTTQLDIVSLVETKMCGGRISDFEKNILNCLGERLNIPVYSVFSDMDLSNFTVWNLCTGELVKEMKMKEFLKYWGEGFII